MKKLRAEQTLLGEAIAGAVSGFVATVPMTVAMLVIQRMLPRREQTTLEPRRISEDMLRKADLHDDFTERGKEQFSVAAHFGYGAGVGMIYAMADRVMPLPRGLRGPAYGMLVWAASYAGWLPAVKTLPPPQRRPAGRNLLLIVSHLVWGAAAEGMTTYLLKRPTARRRASR
jgi:uncharacterized membrane protein YagU involved in acid resistance